MESVGAGTVIQRSSVRSVSNPLARIGNDRLLLDDVTVYGLRRQVIARKGEPPEVSDFLNTVERKHPQANVYAWCFEKEDGFWYLWIVWKETR
jgi:hypothetical protein